MFVPRTTSSLELYDYTLSSNTKSCLKYGKGRIGQPLYVTLVLARNVYVFYFWFHIFCGGRVIYMGGGVYFFSRKIGAQEIFFGGGIHNIKFSREMKYIRGVLKMN